MSLKFIVSCKDNQSFKTTVLAATPGCLCIVDVFSEWCGPCDALNKKLQGLYLDMPECVVLFAVTAAGFRITLSHGAAGMISSLFKPRRIRLSY